MTTPSVDPHLLTNPVRHYAWGSRRFIPELLGRAPDGRPWAELWVGAHPDDPSALADGTPLTALVERHAGRVLGDRVRSRFGDRLPYLCKVLSAATPLSLQVHPDTDQARRGYAAEEAAGVDRAAPQRRYKDPHAKPELVLALTPFEALSGVRPLAQTRLLLAGLTVDHPEWAPLTALLEGGDEEAALRAYLSAVLDGGVGRGDLVQALGAACRQVRGPEASTLADLAGRHPGDPGVLVAVLLNRVSLAPGEAMFLAPGLVHAYLSGDAVEIMGASDNVLRAGLTDKHVDPAEVLSLSVLTPARPAVLRPPWRAGVRRFAPPTPELEVTVVSGPPDPVQLTSDGPQVVLAVAGSSVLRTGDGRDQPLRRGQAALVEAATGSVQVSGPGTVVVTAVPPG